MALKNRGNTVIADHGEWLEIDTTTGRFPSSIKIGRADWEFIKEIKSVRGRISIASTPNGHLYPVLSIRNGAKRVSLLNALFKSPKGVQCISEDWLDLRRENLAPYGPTLKRCNEEGFSPVPPAHGRKTNAILREVGGIVTLDAETEKFPGAEVMLHREDYVFLQARQAGRISYKVVGGSWYADADSAYVMPRCGYRFPDGSRGNDMLTYVLFGRTAEYAKKEKNNPVRAAHTYNLTRDNIKCVAEDGVIRRPDGTPVDHMNLTAEDMEWM